MPAALADFAPRTIGEKVIFSLNYTQLLASGETIGTSTWSLSLVSGTDPSVGTRVSGGPSVNGAVVSQLVNLTSGMSSGARYLIQCAASTSLGQVLVGFSHFNVNAAV